MYGTLGVFVFTYIIFCYSLYRRVIQALYGIILLYNYIFQVQKQMVREYEQLKATVATLQMFQHEGEKAIAPMVGCELLVYILWLPLI